MHKGQPKKPTSPFGYINFPKSGGAEKRMFKLSDIKPHQEEQVVRAFLKHIEKTIDLKSWAALPERDNDFRLTLSSQEIDLEATELVERSFASPMTMEEYNHGSWTKSLARGHGEIPWKVDTSKVKSRLADLIRLKVEKNYATSRPLWLLVFTTSVFYTTQMIDCDRKEDSPLLNAQLYLSALNPVPFEQVWYFDLVTRPIRVWPA